MNPIDVQFQKLRGAERRAFIPFLTAGDPTVDETIRLVDVLAACGADLIEIGFPYSDPIADGPVIQASYNRALSNGVTVKKVFHQFARLHSETASRGERVPLVAMVSYAIVNRFGVEAFVVEAKRAGFSGCIVPDLPVDEADAMARIAAGADFKLILLVTPTTARDRAVAIARQSTGFIYFVSVVGITGERKKISDTVLTQIAWLKQQTDTPICVGFGISEPAHVRQCAPVADGVIVGSAIVRTVTEHRSSSPDEIATAVRNLVKPLVEATRAVPV